MKYKIRVLCLFIVIVLLAIIAPSQPVFAAPAISISPLSGVSGTTVTVSGSGFGAYAGSRLLIYFDDTYVAPNSGTISSGGNFQATFPVPDSAISGMHVISIRGLTNEVLAESQFYVSSQEIILSAWSGAVGTTIKAFCKGFHAGKEVDIRYYYTDTSEIISSQTASDTGECTEEFNIPASSMGSHEVIAQNGFGDSAQTDFEVIPSLSIDPPTGGVGDKVSISGTGFTGNSEIGVTLHGKEVALAEVSERGSFEAIFYVPVIKVGTYVIEIEDPSQSKRWVDFTVESEITLSKSTGPVSQKLLVNGTGFEPGGTVQIKYDDDEMATTMAGSNGSFSASFDVPVSVAGTHVVTVTDGLNTKQADFTVEADTPAAPQPTVPKRDSIVGAQVTFDWESVYDPSEPISYTLQIARTDNFLQPILEKKGLSLSHYTLTEQEELLSSRRATHYYWRVRATDSASNEGAWSKPIAFQVEPSNSLPEWGEYVLIFIGIILAIIAAFRITKAAKAAREEKKT